MQRATTQQTSLRVLLNGQETFVPEHDVLDQLEADGIIRIPADEFELIPQNTFAHFNLEVCGHEIGKRYVLLKIIAHGFFRPSTNEERLPLLDLSSVRLGRCIEVEEHLSYKDLSSKHFEHSMKSIQNQNELQAMIWKRYHQSMPDISREAMMQLGVSWTLLEMQR